MHATHRHVGYPSSGRASVRLPDYTRDTSAFVLAMVQLGDPVAFVAGGAALKYMLRTCSAECACHIVIEIAQSFMILGSFVTRVCCVGTFAKPGLKDHTTNDVITLDRAPHCTWDFTRKDAPLDFCPTFGNTSCVTGRNCTCFAKGNYSSEPFHDQVDGNAHLLIAFDRWCTAAGAYTILPLRPTKS